jgi:hypothetical protein
MIVVLIACKTGSGANSFAQKLANELKTHVLAPEKFVGIDKDGSLYNGNLDANGKINTSKANQALNFFSGSK